MKERTGCSGADEGCEQGARRRAERGSKPREGEREGEMTSLEIRWKDGDAKKGARYEVGDRRE